LSSAAKAEDKLAADIAGSLNIGSTTADATASAKTGEVASLVMLNSNIRKLL
jgi:hypothetical protein